MDGQWVEVAGGSVQDGLRADGVGELWSCKRGVWVAGPGLLWLLPFPVFLLSRFYFFCLLRRRPLSGKPSRRFSVFISQFRYFVYCGFFLHSF